MPRPWPAMALPALTPPRAATNLPLATAAAAAATTTHTAALIERRLSAMATPSEEAPINLKLINPVATTTTASSPTRRSLATAAAATCNTTITRTLL